MAKSGVDWCVVGPGNNQVQCLRCQVVENIPVPLPVKAFVRWSEYFQEKHRHCRENGATERTERDGE